nr:hypothetical protein [Tanacetum cinerariifolium]
MHERPAGKIGVYTRLFEYANFRLPLSTSLLMCLDPLPKSTEFNVDHYVALVAHPAPFQKFSEPFLCLVRMSRYYTLDEDTYPMFLHDDGEEMDLFAFIHVVDHTKVKIIERECVEGEKRLLDSTVGRVVSLLPIAPAYAKGDLEASVDKLFDEGGSTDQGDSAVGGGHDVEIVPVTKVENIAVVNVTAERPKRPRKERPAATDASGSSHPPKKLRGVTELLMGLLLAVNLRSSTDPLSVMTDVVITTSIASAPFIPVPEVATKITPQIQHSIFYDSSSAGTMKPDVVDPSHLPKKELLMGSREINSETLHEVFVPQWNVPNDTLLDDHDVSWDFIDHLAPPVLFAQIRKMDYHHLFMEFNVGTTRQACLNAEVMMRTEYCLSRRRILESECERQADLLKGSAVEVTEKVHAGGMDALKHKNDLELKDLNVDVSSLKSQNDGLVDQVHMLEATCSGLRDQVSNYELLKEQIEAFQDAQMKVLDDKVAKLDADLLEMALHLEEKFYTRLLTTISGRRCLLTRGQKHAIVKCLNSPKSLAALGAASSQDVVAYNPVVESYFNSALQRLREVDFLLLYELSSHKDASIANIMNMLHLESPLVDAPRMSDLHPDVEQLTLPIHRPEDQVVLGETSLSFTLSVAHSRVERIRENVAAQRSALIDIWFPLVDPLSTENLIGVASTSGNVPAAVVTTTALSITFASTSSIPPITIDDYEIVSSDGEEDA